MSKVHMFASPSKSNDPKRVRDPRRGFPGSLILVALICASSFGVPCQRAVAEAEPANAGTLPRVRLMSQEQYFNSLVDLFGADVRIPARFPPFTRTDGLLASAAASAGVTLDGLQRFQQTAAAVAMLVVDPGHRDFLIPCKPASVSAADRRCAKRFFVDTGRMLHRRPLRDADLRELVAKASESADRLKDFYAGLAVALEGMLVSPRFMFITDITEADPARPGQHRFDAYSLAARLSYFLWNSAPDDRLLRSADSGALYSQEGRAHEVDRMLASPRLETGVRAFFDDLFAFDDIDNLTKDPEVYAKFTGATAADAREQTLRTVVDHLLTRKGDYRDLYTTRSTFISPALAVLYEQPTGRGWMRHEFSEDSPRVGLLTQISFLALHSHPARSSPTLRGKALRELLLCQTVPKPPANVDFSNIEDPSANLRTARERLDVHRTNPACAGCHKITDPMGLALENFDGAGQFRTTEKGAPIDVSGTFDGQKFDDVVGLGKALRNHPALTSCFVNRLFSYGTGGPATPDDREVLEYLESRFEAHGYQLPALLRTIALSRAFAQVAEKRSPVPAEKKTLTTAVN